MKSEEEELVEKIPKRKCLLFPRLFVNMLPLVYKSLIKK